MKRTTLILGCLLLLAAMSGCNEDPQRTPFNLDTGNQDAGQSDIEVSDTGSQDAGDVSDARRWYETACETTSPRDVTIEENEQGNWAFAVPQHITDYQTLRPAGYETPHAAAVMNAQEVGVAGALVSRPMEISESNSVDAILQQALKDSLPEGLAEGEHSTFSTSYETRDGRSASQARIWVEADKPMDAGDVRDRILAHLADFSPADVDINSNYEGEEGSEFQLFVTLQSMPTSGSNRRHGVFSVSVAPESRYYESEPTRQTTEDIRLSKNLAPVGTSRSDACDKFPIRIGTRKYTYLVIDTDGPGEYSKNVERFFKEAADLVFDSQVPPLVRLGVTNTVMANKGRFVHDGWLNDKEEFLQAIKDAATECKPTDDWACEGERDGLAVAESGLEYMENDEDPPPRDVRMVPNNITAVGIISDENPHTIAYGGRPVEEYRPLARDISQIIAPQGSCADEQKVGESYTDLFGDDDYTHLDDYCRMEDELNVENPTFRHFAYKFRLTGRLVHPAQLSSIPLTPSLRASLNGKEVPRSRENGFSFYAEHNTPSLNGSYSDIGLDPFNGPYFVAYRYSSWDYGSED